MYAVGGFDSALFSYYLYSLRSSWEAVRSTCTELLAGFPDDYELVNEEFLHGNLISSGFELTKNPVIKNAEGGAIILSLVAARFIKNVNFNKLDFPSKEKYMANEGVLKETLFCHYILDTIESRFAEMKKNFLDNESHFAQNLIHGLFTTLSFILQNLVKHEGLTDQKYKDSFVKFFNRLSETIISVLSYATKLSADNISTCILDNDLTLQKMHEVSGKNKLKLARK